MDNKKMRMYQKDMEGLTGDIEEITESIIALTDKKATATALVHELRELVAEKQKIFCNAQHEGYSGDTTQEFLLENFSDETTKG